MEIYTPFDVLSFFRLYSHPNMNIENFIVFAVSQKTIFGLGDKYEP